MLLLFAMLFPGEAWRAPLESDTLTVYHSFVSRSLWSSPPRYGQKHQNTNTHRPHRRVRDAQDTVRYIVFS